MSDSEETFVRCIVCYVVFDVETSYVLEDMPMCHKCVDMVREVPDRVAFDCAGCSTKCTHGFKSRGVYECDKCYSPRNPVEWDEYEGSVLNMVKTPKFDLLAVDDHKSIMFSFDDLEISNADGVRDVDHHTDKSMLGESLCSLEDLCMENRHNHSFGNLLSCVWVWRTYLDLEPDPRVNRMLNALSIKLYSYTYLRAWHEKGMPILSSVSTDLKPFPCTAGSRLWRNCLLTPWHNRLVVSDLANRRVKTIRLPNMPAVCDGMVWYEHDNRVWEARFCSFDAPLEFVTVPGEKIQIENKPDSHNITTSIAQRIAVCIGDQHHRPDPNKVEVFHTDLCSVKIVPRKRHVFHAPYCKGWVQIPYCSYHPARSQPISPVVIDYNDRWLVTTSGIFQI